MRRLHDCREQSGSLQRVKDPYLRHRGDFTNCSACPDYACEPLTAFFQVVPQAQANLEVGRKTKLKQLTGNGKNRGCSPIPGFLFN